jgi:pyruvate dehydrogenase E2 component (dihydrolipoamide acetyltransferase)
MATEFVLPVLGDGIDGGTLVKILVSVGDTIEEGQNVLELETDKAVLEVPSTVSGKIQAIAVQEGAKVNIGDAVFTVDESAAGGEEEAPAEEEEAPAAEEEAPTTGEEPVETAAAPAPEKKQEAKAKPAPAPATPVAGGDEYAPVPASPSTRRFAREIGLDIQSVTGTGPGGRISEGDVKSRAREILSSGGGVATGVPAAPLPDFSKFGLIETEAFSNVRRATSNQMARSWQAPHVTQFDKADITSIEKLRKKYSPLAEKQGGKLTVTAILIKVIVAALKKFPQFNSSLDLANEQLILKKYYNIGVAVDTERGLLVPVIHNADQKSLFAIAAELGEIAERARNKKTGLQELQGGCFTLTNLGGIGGTQFTPIVNTPEVAILGVARGGMEPVWNKETNAFEPRLMLPLCLSYDHRVIDGADGARFLRFIAEALEEPFLLSLES